MRALINSKQLYVAVAALVLAVVVTPVAIAGAAGGAKKSPVAKQVKQLKQQITAVQQQAAELRQQIANLQGQANTPRPPSGPAGGDLTGTFPNPVIGPDAVGAAEIQKDGVGPLEIQADAVGTEEIAENSIDSPDIATAAVDAAEIGQSAVRTSEIGDYEVTSIDLDFGSVGGAALKPVTAVVGPGVTVSAGAPQTTSVTCPGGRQLIAGGFGWTDKEKSTILASAPSEGSPTTTWTVEGMVDSGSNGLFAWASCITE